jgi:hypothetical protein
MEASGSTVSIKDCFLLIRGFRRNFSYCSSFIDGIHLHPNNNPGIVFKKYDICVQLLLLNNFIMEQAESKKPGIFKVMGGFIGAIIGYLAVQYFLLPLILTPSIGKQLVEAVNEMNKNCPIMVDKETRLDNTMTFPPHKFQYNYTLLNHTKEEIDVKVLEDYVKPILLSNVRTEPRMKVFRDNDVTIVYNYKDKNGAFVLDIPLTPADYKEKSN